jgi:hypothetical protein
MHRPKTQIEKVGTKGGLAANKKFAESPDWVVT